MISTHPSRNGVSKSQVRDQRRRRGERDRVPARSRRFSTADMARARTLILGGMQRQQVAKAIGCTTETLRRWYADAKKHELVTKPATKPGAGAASPGPAESSTAPTVATSTPHDPGAGLGEHERAPGARRRQQWRSRRATACDDIATACDAGLRDPACVPSRRRRLKICG